MKCPSCKLDNPDTALRCDCGYSFATGGAAAQGPQPERLKQPSSSGPSIGQALIWGFVAAAFGGLFAWIGKLLSSSPQAPPTVDPLHGLSSPAEMNKHIDTLLSAGGAALAHDHSLANTLWIIVVGVCLVSLASAFIYIQRMRSRPVPSGWRTAGVILLLGLPPVVITSAISIKKDGLFQAGLILQGLENENTRPGVVSRGKEVGVTIPVAMQSFFGYHQSVSFALRSSVALLPDGSRVPVKLDNPAMGVGGRKPGSTDVIPLMEDVKPKATFTIPDDPRLDGAIIKVATSGTLNILPQSHPDAFSSEDYTASTRFRVATEKEVQFASEYSQISDNISNVGWLSWPSLVAVIAGIILGTPGACKKCLKKVNRMKIFDGHLCRECFNSSQTKEPAQARVSG